VKNLYFVLGRPTIGYPGPIIGFGRGPRPSALAWAGEISGVKGRTWRMGWADNHRGRAPGNMVLWDLGQGDRDIGVEHGRTRRMSRWGARRVPREARRRN